jgi:transposase
MNTKLHAVADANGRPLSFFMTAGQVSDYTGAAALLDDLPKAQWLLGDRGYDADWFRDALQAKGTSPASRAANRATSPSGTTSAAIAVAAASRSCSAASRTGDASLPAMIAAQPPSSLPSPWQQPLSSGCDQRVPTLNKVK